MSEIKKPTEMEEGYELGRHASEVLKLIRKECFEKYAYEIYVSIEGYIITEEGVVLSMAEESLDRIDAGKSMGPIPKNYSAFIEIGFKLDQADLIPDSVIDMDNVESVVVKCYRTGEAIHRMVRVHTPNLDPLISRYDRTIAHLFDQSDSEKKSDKLPGLNENLIGEDL